MGLLVHIGRGVGLRVRAVGLGVHTGRGVGRLVQTGLGVGLRVGRGLFVGLGVGCGAKVFQNFFKSKQPLLDHKNFEKKLEWIHLESAYLDNIIFQSLLQG